MGFLYEVTSLRKVNFQFSSFLPYRKARNIFDARVHTLNINVFCSFKEKPSNILLRKSGHSFSVPIIIQYCTIECLSLSPSELCMLYYVLVSNCWIVGDKPLEMQSSNNEPLFLSLVFDRVLFLKLSLRS